MRIPMLVSTVVVVFLVMFCGKAYTSEVNYKQVDTIFLFFETMNNKQIPTVSDFNKLFGENNEAELELILEQKYPDLQGQWMNNKKIIKYTKAVSEQPRKYPSRFLMLIRNSVPEIFSKKSKRRLEFPPEITKDFKKYSIITDESRVVFIFSRDECTIEDIELPDGKSIYTLIKGKKQ